MIEGDYIDAGSDAYWHVWVYGIDFADGTHLGPQGAPMFLLDHEHVTREEDWDDDTDAWEAPMNERLFVAAIKEKLAALYDKPIEEFSFQVCTAVAPGQTFGWDQEPEGEEDEEYA